jgi:hypothetical protein
MPTKIPNFPLSKSKIIIKNHNKKTKEPLDASL